VRASVFAELRGVAPVVVASRIGLAVRRGACGPCPMCGADRRGSEDRRPPITMDDRAWRCHRCQARGDAAALLAAHTLRRPAHGPADAEAVRRAAELVGLLAPSDPGALPPRAPAPPPPSIIPAMDRPGPAPRSEVAALWAAARPVTSDAEAEAWLRGRALDPLAVAGLDLARALPASAALPAWARIGGRPWSDGWRLLLPVWGADGCMTGLRARWCGPGEAPRAKEVGGRGISAGPGVYADPVGRWLLARGPGARRAELAGGPFAWPWSGVVVIGEGGPDWLTLAASDARSSHGRPTAAVFAVWAGAWSPELAARIPMGARVRLWTHGDDAGEQYAREVIASLPGREIERETP
jgi:hypothetical protein